MDLQKEMQCVYNETSWFYGSLQWKALILDMFNKIGKWMFSDVMCLLRSKEFKFQPKF
jgi:hypothetical protein